MLTARVKIRMPDDYMPVVPIIIPDLEEVREFASKLHAKNENWQGEFLGWQAEYNAQKTTSPIDSAMEFTPADFCIGESNIWFFSLMWEHGQDAEPVEFLDDKNVLEQTIAI